jgi:hypothetical protein
MTLCQQQPYRAWFTSRTPVFTNRCCKLARDQLLILCGNVTHTATLPTDQRANPFRRLVAAMRKVAAEMATEKRYRTCTEEQQAPWYRSRWFMHWAIMWGFIGLAAATTLDYLLLLLADKVPGQPVPLWHPIRLLGTLTGVLVLFGTLRAGFSRQKAREILEPLAALGLVVPVAFAAGHGYRLPGRSRTLPAARNRLGLCCLPSPRDLGHGDRLVVPLH